MNISTATPAEIDTRLAEIHHAAAPHLARAMQYRGAANDYRNPSGWGRVDEAMADRYDAKADVEITAYKERVAEAAPYNAEFEARGGWTRAFIVPGGHVHRSQSCSSCYPTTEFGWLPEWSGQDETGIVDAAGERACTVCYPSAPVESLGRPSRMFHASEVAAEEARQARAARSAEIAAKKAAKAIGPVRVFNYHAPERHANMGGGQVKVIAAHDVFETLDTVHAAKGWLTDAFESWRSRSERPEDVAAVAEALAVKFGTTAAEQVEAAKVRAAKRK